MISDLEVRYLTLADETQILEVFSSLESGYPFPIGGVWTPQKIREELKLGRAVGALQHGELLAFVIFRESLDIKEITLLATRPSAQKKGIMVSLLKWLAQSLESSSAIWLEVHALNKPAIALYKRAGFVQNGERKSYYQDGASALLFEYKPLQ